VRSTPSALSHGPHWQYEYDWAAWDRLSDAGRDGWRVVPGATHMLDGAKVFLIERIKEDPIPSEA